MLSHSPRLLFQHPFLFCNFLYTKRKGVLEAWKTYLLGKRNRLNFLLTLSVLIIVLIILPNFLRFVENRSGFDFRDPILSLFNPVDLTWFTFALIYAGLVIAVIHLAKKPSSLVLAMKTYAITAIFRIIAMYLLPLEPPQTMIPLNDPFVQLFGPGEVLTKDLFFSGHTSTLFILFLTAQKRILKYVFLIFTILVAVCVIVQHVHYSIDILAALVFAFTSYKIAQSLEKYFEQ